jgi:glycosyltransferase involved in cell wall biosynthesis
MNGNNRFVFVSPMYEASATLSRMLHSLYGQSYDNWAVVLVDDMSSQRSRDHADSVVNTFNQMDPHIRFIKNTEKRWEVANVLAGIKDTCKDDDIVCRIDADDWLVDLDALAILDHAYRSDPELDAIWTAHRWGFSDKSISDALPNGADPYKHQWVSSHLKTWRKRVMNEVDDRNYRGQDGEYIRRAGDQAIYLPILKLARKRAYLPRVFYHYTIEDVPKTYQSDDARFQRDEAIFLRERGYVG